MAEKLTPQQQQAVENRGGKLLVSAAAGSGKTKVLVDRLMSYLLDPVSPANIDDFLIITYTKAAAAELRGKIAGKLTERMAQMPENRHLQRQFQRLYLTQISTVHAFCSVILKEYAHMLDIPGDFRVADENECAELREIAIEKVLEQAYENAADNRDFCAFVDSQGLGRDDRQVPQIVMKVYDSARCHLRPEAWLQHCLDCTEAKQATDAAQTVYGRYLMQRFFEWLDPQIAAMERCALDASKVEGLEKPSSLLADTVWQLKRLRQCASWDEILNHQSIDFGTLRFPKKCPDEDLVQHIKAVRDACKKGLAKQLKPFADASAAVLQELSGSADAVRGMIGLVRRFEQTYDRMKRSRRILDFGDLEHHTLDLLYGKSRSGITAVAREIGSRFREVMVDEYQDSNAVQDAIYGALTEKKQNLFLVGDVKQSIYQFRLADPGIFLEKYASFAHADEAAPGEGRKVLLSRNFRSGGAVLEAVNDVFKLCMSPQVGGLHYGAEEALYEGVPHAPLGQPEVRLHCVDVQEDTYREEADYVADQIQRMIQSGEPVRSGDGTRPVQAEDIVILLRSPGSVGIHYQRALESRGIRCVSGGGEDLLQTPHIGLLHSLLQTIHNPLLDIPLVAVLASPIFGFTADDLARIRSGRKFDSFYSALLQARDPKSIEFVRMLTALRTIARQQPLTVLMEEILLRTHLDSLFGAMEDGEKRLEDLETFFQLASSMEAGGTRDLGRFLQHLDTLAQKGMTASSDQAGNGSVTIMSIHKSKGLEFPVVFLCGLSRQFNMESQRAAILCHKEMGLGMAAVDHERRLRYPTIAKRAIAAKMAEESLSEELRVLYVAMTRARDIMIMTYASDSLEKELQQMVLRLDMGGKDLLVREAVCPGEWILLSALHRTEAGELFQLGGKPKDTTPGEPAWQIRVVQAPVHGQNTALEEMPIRKNLPDEALLRRILEDRYSHAAATAAPSKLTATQQKGRIKDEEAAADTPAKLERTKPWRQAAFGKQTLDGRTYGNAIHSAMQYLDFSACGDLEGIRREIHRLEQQRFLSADQAKMIQPELIHNFLCTPLGQKVSQSDQLIREFKFSILIDGAEYDPACAGEKILLQGVVDCALVEEDGIILIDFKTDHVTDETVDAVASSYGQQVRTYADALHRIYEKDVKEAYLYFFRLNRFVRV